jgi:lipoprotein NlpI
MSLLCRGSEVRNYRVSQHDSPCTHIFWAWAVVIIPLRHIITATAAQASKAAAANIIMFAQKMHAAAFYISINTHAAAAATATTKLSRNDL